MDTTTKPAIDQFQAPDYTQSPIGMAFFTTYDGKSMVAARCFGSYRCFANHDEHEGARDARAWIALTLRQYIRKNDKPT